MNYFYFTSYFRLSVDSVGLVNKKQNRQSAVTKMGYKPCTSLVKDNTDIRELLGVVDKEGKASEHS